MAAKAPAFWWCESSLAAALLAPVAAGYGAITARRMERPGWRAAVPVICVGNFTVGGAGKTPAAIAVARLLIARGLRVFFLSRGYGGRLAGPVLVAGHGAADVGDEPLLLARTAPAIVSRDRPAGAVDAARRGADVIVMDDGLQNPSLSKDLTIAVVDGRRGVGNGRVFPAGPLRAPLARQFDRTDVVLIVGRPGVAAGRVLDAALRRGKALVHGEFVPDPEVVAALAGKPVLAFAGIADPDKFFATLEAAGIAVAARRRFPDHHRFAPAEARSLLDEAERGGFTLVTTEKDTARMRRDPSAVLLLERCTAFPVTLAIRPENEAERLLLQAVRPSLGSTAPDRGATA